MAAAPKWKIYSAANKYMGCMVYVEDAINAALSMGDGTTVRAMHPKKWTVFTAGQDDIGAESAHDRLLELGRIHQEKNRERWREMVRNGQVASSPYGEQETPNAPQTHPNR